jgi:hypothetical protein
MIQRNAKPPGSTRTPARHVGRDLGKLRGSALENYSVLSDKNEKSLSEKCKEALKQTGIKP